jgi:hypothetical protein
MAFTKETKWFCENASALEKFSGKWVGFSVEKGVLSNGDKLSMVMKKLGSRQAIKKSFVFHVPSKDELQVPRPADRPSGRV